MSSNNSSRRGGFGLTTVVTIVFVVLKLTHTINWSWVWVLSPLWISFLLTVAALFIAGVALGSARKQAQQQRSNEVLAQIRARRIADERKQQGENGAYRLPYFDQRNGIR